MCIKLMAIGVKKYCSEGMNLIDGGVVILSLIELTLTAAGTSSGAGKQF